jgi:predicted Zn-dependent protease
MRRLRRSFVWACLLLALLAAPRAAHGQGDAAGRFLALAAAHMDRARTTADPVWYERAESAARAALALAPDGPEALRLRAWIRAGQHRFREAAELAREATRRAPDDARAFGALGDALLELGDVDGATVAIERMVSLRPDGAGYARIAYLRELTGDREGADEALALALRATDPRARGQRAWLLAQRGELRFGSGDVAGAARELEAALALEPALRGARIALARVRAAEGRIADAAERYARLQSERPSAAVAAAYADVLRTLGRPGEAARQEALLSDESGVMEAREDVEPRELAALRAERGLDPRGALAVAERELVLRADVFGWDAVSWCALHAGEIARAREASAQALRLGTRDARLLAHAGHVALAAGARAEAEQRLREALALAPAFDLRGAEAAQAALARLGAASAADAQKRRVSPISSTGASSAAYPAAAAAARNRRGGSSYGSSERSKVP